MTTAPAEPGSARRPVVEIEYCTSCSYTRRALWVASEILGELEHNIAGLRLICGTKGVFNVAVDGVSVFSKAATGRFPEPTELTVRIFELIDAE
jgi:selenoprotein W-related protein